MLNAEIRVCYLEVNGGWIEVCGLLLLAMMWRWARRGDVKVMQDSTVRGACLRFLKTGWPTSTDFS